MRLTPIAIAVSLALLSGCAGVKKEEIGTLVGGVVGGVVGNKVGGKTGAVIGVAVGAMIGNRIGAHLDEEDRKRLAALEAKALATGTGGTFVTNKTKATVKVDVAQPTYEKPRDYGVAETVKPEPLVLIDPITIRTYVDTPIYNATDEGGAPKVVIAAGVPIKISARATNGDWMMVGTENVGLGYVPKRYLESNIVSEARRTATPAPPAPQAPTRTAQNQPRPGTTAAAPAPAPAKRMAAMSKEEYEKEMDRLHAAYKPRSSEGAVSQTGSRQPPSTNIGGAQGSQGVVLAQASSECKVVTRQVTPPPGGGGPFSETVKYCNEPPKGWQTQTA